MKWETIFDLPAQNSELKKLENQSLEENFWSNSDNAKKILKEIAILKEKIQNFKDAESKMEDVKVLLEFVEAGEEEFNKELEEKTKIFINTISEMELKFLLNNDHDTNNAIVLIHSGAGGTEACDWAEMLYRLYTRWAAQKKYKVEILDKLNGECAGIKSITLLVSGIYAYGYLKGEKGVHRLVRISPFDSNKRRHTSFASIDIMPEIDDDVTIEINTKDLKIDTYRASGAGGQHINMTDSAVRITHLPTNTVVTCQKERSQLKNRETALKILKSKLLELELRKKEEAIAKIKGENFSIGWGNQIRSYVFQPYSLVKDHRTNYEDSNVESVMDGNIDNFIYNYLKWKK